MSDERDKPNPCTGKTATGRPCKAAPVPGTTRCWHHSFKVPGRPSKLTPELTERILDAVLEGAYLETAAQAVGINKTTLYRWLRRADDVEATALEHVDTDNPNVTLADLYDHIDPAEWVYLDFRHALKSAEAFAELELLRLTTRDHGGQPWQAYMTVLERRHPAKWGRRDKVTHDGAVTAAKPVVVVVEEEDRRAALTKLLHTAGALATQPGGDPE
jgi:hypothetical protein